MEVNAQDLPLLPSSARLDPPPPGLPPPVVPSITFFRRPLCPCPPGPQVRISAASADQRRGRAGRTGPGSCYRLWEEGDQLQGVRQEAGQGAVGGMVSVLKVLSCSVRGLAPLEAPIAPVVACS